MIYHENQCCDCATAGYPCTFCGLQKVKIIACDRCEDQADRLFWVDGEQVCIECARKMLPYNEEDDTFDVDGVWVPWCDLDEYLEEVDTYNV